MKYTYKIINELVKNSKSISQMIRKLGLKQAGGTHYHISKLIKKFNINNSHFTGRGSNRGKNHKGGIKKRTLKEIFVLRTKNQVREKTSVLKNALIEIGAKYECNECGIKNSWNGKSITLHVDHKNGNWLDNRKNNLQFLCPNCHSQTATYCRKK